MGIERALDVAATIMKNGGSTTAAERSIGNILARDGKPEVTVVWRLDYIAATTNEDGRLVTYIKPIPTMSINLAQAAGAMTVAERVGRGDVGVDGLGPELDRVWRMAPPYGAWVRIAASAVAAASFARMTGCAWSGAAIAAVGAAAGQYVRPLLLTRGMSGAPVTLVCGMVTTIVAGAGVRAFGAPGELPTLIASTIYLVPGLALINGYLDMVSHRYLVVGLERIASAVVIFLILAIVVALAYVVF